MLSIVHIESCQQNLRHCFNIVWPNRRKSVLSWDEEILSTKCCQPRCKCAIISLRSWIRTEQRYWEHVSTHILFSCTMREHWNRNYTFFVQKIRNTYHLTGNYKGNNFYSLQFSIWSYSFRVIFIKLIVNSFTLNVAYHEHSRYAVPYSNAFFLTVTVRSFSRLSKGVGIDTVRKTKTMYMYFILLKEDLRRYTYLANFFFIRVCRELIGVEKKKATYASFR